jgi:hypothetical protein
MLDRLIPADAGCGGVEIDRPASQVWALVADYGNVRCPPIGALR